MYKKITSLLIVLKKLAEISLQQCFSTLAIERYVDFSSQKLPARMEIKELYVIGQW